MKTMPMFPMRTTNGEYDEWYFPHEHMWLRLHENRWMVGHWNMGGTQQWLDVGGADIIFSPEQALAAWIATRRME